MATVHVVAKELDKTKQLSNSRAGISCCLSKIMVPLRQKFPSGYIKSQ